MGINYEVRDSIVAAGCYLTSFLFYAPHARGYYAAVSRPNKLIKYRHTDIQRDSYRAAIAPPRHSEGPVLDEL